MTQVESKPESSTVHLQRTIGFWGLMFVSLGSIIGSGWLLGALDAAQVAGPAAILSWVLAAGMLTVLALIHAELGAAYPVAGGTARFPYFAFGTLAGFTAGWSAWLQAVAIAPIEIEASISYVSSVGWVKEHFVMLHADGTLNWRGLIVAILGMLLFTAMNLAGAKFLSESNSIMVIWKTAVPVLTIVVIVALSFHPSNFSHQGVGFMPHGFHGVFAALALGVVFALQGFEQAVQLAGEAKNPKKDLSRAIITAMTIGAVLYIGLQIAFIGGVQPNDIAHGWANPIGVGDYGPYYTLAIAAGASWLAYVLIIDGVISPAGTGLVYVGTSARLSYALGEEEVLPRQLTQLNKRGVPAFSILLAAGVGILCFAPFPSWSKLVGVVTSATAIMYAFAPIALAALHRRDNDRERSYRMPMPKLLNPVGFISANLIIYWGGFDTTWKLVLALGIGRVLFEIRLRRADPVKRTDIDWRAASWIWPWLIGMVILGVVGRYGKDAYPTLPEIPEWWDLGVVILFSLGIFYYAVDLAMDKEKVQAAIQVDIDNQQEFLLPALPELSKAKR